MLDGGERATTARTMLRLVGLGMSADETAIVAGVDLALDAGPPTVLIGPNGSGKTTLLRLMMGLAEPTAGHIELTPGADGRPTRRAFVFQKPVMLKRSAAENVAFALTAAGRPAEPARITELLEQAGLGQIAGRPARLLSGGEQQRLALARALAREPDILFLDEPTASLDPAQTKAVEDIVAAVAAQGVKVVMATHDLGQARRLAGDVVFLVRGQVAEHAPAARFFQLPETENARRFLAGDLVV